MAAIISGPRLGKFTKDGSPIKFDNSSTANMVLGVMILWLGWYGFNAGSTGCAYGCMYSAGLAAVNTTLSIASGGLTCLIASVVMGRPADVGELLNGILAGAVSATANCALVHNYAAVIIGAVGAIIYMTASSTLIRMKIDDPVDASPVHFFCGAWGLLASGFFATENNVISVYGYANDWGVFYGGKGYQLGLQVLGIVMIAVWTCTLNGVLFFVLKKFNSLRVSEEAENQGLDVLMGIGTGQAFQCFHKFMEKE